MIARAALAAESWMPMRGAAPQPKSPLDFPSSQALAQAEELVADTAAVERALATEMERAWRDVPLDDPYRLYLLDVKNGPPTLSREDAIAAAKRHDYKRLVEGNLRLVIFLALRAKVRIPYQARMDLIQEGNLGLMRAAEQYDWTRGCSFSGYACWWIERFVWNEAWRQDNPGGLLRSNDRRTIKALRTVQRDHDESGTTLEETTAYIKAEAVPAPKELRRWPAADESRSLDALFGGGVWYLSQVFTGTVAQYDGTKMPIPVTDLIAGPDLVLPDPSPTEDESGAPRQLLGRPGLQQMRADLTLAAAQHWLAPREVELVALRFGVPHPDQSWKPPKEWRAGMMHSLAWLRRYWAPWDVRPQKRKGSKQEPAPVPTRNLTSPSGNRCGKYTVQRHLEQVAYTLSHRPEREAQRLADALTSRGLVVRIDGHVSKIPGKI